jgi:hypothetical protein
MGKEVNSPLEKRGRGLYSRLKTNENIEKALRTQRIYN